MAPPKGGNSVKIPERFGAPSKAVEATLQKAAQAAVAEVAKAHKKPEAVMDALADFHDAWLETEAFDAEENVQAFFVKLADHSGADLEPMDAWEEIHLGLFGMEGLATDGLLDTVAELLDSTPQDAEEQLGGFVDAVADGLLRNGRSYLPGFGTFTADDLADVEDPGPYDVQVGLALDPAFEQRLVKAHAGEDTDEADEDAPLGGVVEALMEAFLNEWAVDIDGLGTMACQWDENTPVPVFKPAMELREEILESSGDNDEEPAQNPEN